MKHLLLLILATGVGNQCTHNTQPDAGPPPMATGGAAPATGGSATGGSMPATGGLLAAGGSSAVDDCQAADATLNRLQCSEAKTPKGQAFVDACRAATTMHQDWHPACIAKVTNCKQVAAAYRGCK